MPVRRFVGIAAFDEGVDVRRAVLTDSKKLVVEFESEGIVYTAILVSKDGRYFTGHHEYRSEGGTYKGRAEGRLYVDGDGAALLGKWIEEGTEYQWLLNLDEVESFDS